MGFTLIELIIVIVIIGILAAIAAPMMAGNVGKAKKSEAVSVMGAIRTAERLYFVDTSSYRGVLTSGWSSTPLNTYIGQNDIQGRYFNDVQYSVTTLGTNNDYYINFAGTDVDGKVVGSMFMNSNGLINNY